MTHQSEAPDPVLAALREARQRRDQANEDIRVLLAYARELIQPRPYKLCDLAQAAGISISGVRIAYTTEHVAKAEALSLTLPAPAAGSTR